LHPGILLDFFLKRLFSQKKRLYLITDRTISGLSHSDIVRQAVTSGIDIIQLREKDMPKSQLYKEAAFIRELTLRRRITFIVNDYVDLACTVHADGVHLGQDDMPVQEARKILGKKSIIGISTHNLRQAFQAQHDGADYIGFGPLFSTATKDAGKPKGIHALRKIKRHITIPVVAIGGITLENAPHVMSSGADAIAVASAILSGDIRERVKKFMNVV
jgi:thiamine-phosphate pyrophosphorylase